MIAHTSDGGTTWNTRHFDASNVNGAILNMRDAASCGNNVWAVGDEGLIWFSPDRGVSWSGSFTSFATCATDCACGAGSQVNCNLWAVACEDANTVWVSGEGGVVIRSTDAASTLPELVISIGFTRDFQRLLWFADMLIC